jgi:hypothetical protein
MRMMKSRRMRGAGNVARIGDKRNIWDIVGKPEGKRPLGRPRRKWAAKAKLILEK